jgi:hypothetical protein
VRLNGPRDVAEFAVASPEAHRAFVRQLFQHVVKQPADAFGPAVLEELRASFEQSNFNVQSLLVEIAEVSALRGANAPTAQARAADSDVVSNSGSRAMAGLPGRVSAPAENTAGQAGHGTKKD